jgi:HPr kinase/phosphorylase
VAYNGEALLITGASGSGKSSCALSLMAYGAQLVADDRTQVRRVNEKLIAEAPDRISGLIEARGLGILQADHVASAQVKAIIDLNETENERLPVYRERDILGLSVPLFFRVDAPYFAAALLQFLKAGRSDR